MPYRLTSLFISAAALVILANPLAAQDKQKMIDNALSAAPAGIAADAAVSDWEGNVLREGTNGYTCLPDDPNAPGNSPMCLDETWLGWAHAWMTHGTPPKVESIAIAYMLQGDFPTSNTDPYATEKTADNEWQEDSGPHIMMLVPDASALAGMSDDPGPGPYVMWKGTPYVHVMIPAAKQ